MNDACQLLQTSYLKSSAQSGVNTLKVEQPHRLKASGAAGTGVAEAEGETTEAASATEGEVGAAATATGAETETAET